MDPSNEARSVLRGECESRQGRYVSPDQNSQDRRRQPCLLNPYVSGIADSPPSLGTQIREPQYQARQRSHIEIIRLSYKLLPRTLQKYMRRQPQIDMLMSINPKRQAPSMVSLHYLVLARPGCLFFLTVLIERSVQSPEILPKLTEAHMIP